MAWDTGFRLPETNFFDAAQLAIVRALFDAIHPRDSRRGIPGADDCDAANFLDRMLARPDGDPLVHRDLTRWKAAYPALLAKLDIAAIAAFGKGVAQLSREQTGSLLKQLEDATLSNFEGDQKAAFAMIWRHCIQACWSDPRWGGNRDRIMWRWLGHLYDPQNVLEPEGGA